MIRRDLDLLEALGKVTQLRVFLSIPFRDEDAEKLEPFASPSRRRFETLAMLSARGIDTGLSLSPLILGINDAHVPELLERAAAAGARHAFMTPLRLPDPVAQFFFDELQRHYPELAQKVRHRLEELGDGAVSESRFHARMEGQGAGWALTQQLFHRFAARWGVCSYHNDDYWQRSEKACDTFQRPPAVQERSQSSKEGKQLSLW